MEKENSQINDEFAGLTDELFGALEKSGENLKTLFEHLDFSEIESLTIREQSMLRGHVGQFISSDRRYRRITRAATIEQKAENLIDELTKYRDNYQPMNMTSTKVLKMLDTKAFRFCVEHIVREMAAEKRIGLANEVQRKEGKQRWEGLLEIAKVAQQIEKNRRL